MRKRLLTGVAVVCALVSGNLARAQGVAGQPGWLQDRRFQEGPGARAGNFEIHPGIGAEAGYDSNFLLRSQKSAPNLVNGAPAAPPEESARLRVTPSISFATLGVQRREGRDEQPSVNFRANLSASYNEFFGPALIRDQRNVSVASTARLSILPGRPVGVGIFGGFNRLLSPNVLGNPNLSFNQNIVNAGTELILTPNGGTLDYRFGYQLRFSFYDSTGSSGLNNISHEGYVRGRWAFRPRTSLLYDGSVGYLTYTNLGTTNSLGLLSSVPVRTRFGLQGLVTPRLSLLAMVGYGTTLLQQDAGVASRQFDSVIANAAATFYLTANPAVEDTIGDLSQFISTLTVGAQRDFQQSFLGNYVTTNRGFVNLTSFIAGRAILQLGGGVTLFTYPDIPTVGATNTIRQTSFTDVRPDVSAFSEYRFSDSFAINGLLRYTQNISSTRLPENGPGAPVFDFNWRRIEAMAGVRWFL